MIGLNNIEWNKHALSCNEAILPIEWGVCDRKCTESESTWSDGVRGSDGGVAVGLGGAGPLLEDVEPKIYIVINIVITEKEKKTYQATH